MNENYVVKYSPTNFYPNNPQPSAIAIGGYFIDVATMPKNYNSNEYDMVAAVDNHHDLWLSFDRGTSWNKYGFILDETEEYVKYIHMIDDSESTSYVVSATGVVFDDNTLYIKNSNRGNFTVYIELNQDRIYDLKRGIAVTVGEAGLESLDLNSSLLYSCDRRLYAINGDGILYRITRSYGVFTATTAIANDNIIFVSDIKHSIVLPLDNNFPILAESANSIHIKRGNAHKTHTKSSLSISGNIKKCIHFKNAASQYSNYLISTSANKLYVIKCIASDIDSCTEIVTDFISDIEIYPAGDFIRIDGRVSGSSTYHLNYISNTGTLLYNSSLDTGNVSLNAYKFTTMHIGSSLNKDFYYNKSSAAFYQNNYTYSESILGTETKTYFVCAPSFFVKIFGTTKKYFNVVVSRYTSNGWAVAANTTPLNADVCICHNYNIISDRYEQKITVDGPNNLFKIEVRNTRASISHSIAASCGTMADAAEFDATGMKGSKVAFYDYRYPPFGLTNNYSRFFGQRNTPVLPHTFPYGLSCMINDTNWS